jgi:VIT1/CCC1 family predicted Fe2+/Mn2+ transporter
MYERHEEQLLPLEQFQRRVARHGLVGLMVVAGSLLIGTLGYHLLETMPWIDALLNAAMILTGMGPVTPLATTAGKLFAAAYALYSGIVFLVVTAILVGPFAHRLLHHVHSTNR